jgi:hypothetical protein
MQSPLYGTSATSPSYNVQCPIGAVINRLHAVWGNNFDQLYVNCSNDNPWTAHLGGSGGDQPGTAIISDNGFRGVNTWSADLLDALQPLDANEVPMTKVGGSGGTSFTFKCPAGMYLTGVSGTHHDVVNQIRWHCNYPIDCANSNNVFDARCTDWCTANPTQCATNKGAYCQGANLEQTNCKTFCSQTDTNCDVSFKNYCLSLGSNASTNPLCGCFMPTTFMNSYFDSLALNNLTALVGNRVPACSYAPCATSSQIDYPHKNGQTVCPPLNVSTCISNITVNVNGAINALNAEQKQACSAVSSTGTGTNTNTNTNTDTSANLIVIAAIVIVGFILLLVFGYFLFRSRRPAASPSKVVMSENQASPRNK